MNALTLALLLLITGLSSAMAYELCFMHTTFGGYLPFSFFVLGPTLGYLTGTADSLLRR